MKLAALAPVIALGLAVPALGAEQPRLRVTIEHRGAILVGQSVRMDVTVLVPNFFMSAPQFPIFEIPGAVVTMPDESAVNLNEQIDGVTYAGIQRSYVIVPQQEGDFTLPPEKITFQYAAVPGKPTPGVVTLPPRKFSAKLPVGAKTEEGAIPVARVSVKQTLDRGVQRLHVGDAITRRLDIFASHTQAVMIPPPSFEAPPGVRVYHKDPQLSDVTAERGEFVGGRRVDVATYVFDQPGTYVLPEIDRAGTTRFRPRRDGARSADRDFGGPNPDTQPAIAPEAAPVAAAPEAPQQRVDWQPWLKWGVVALGSLFLIAWLWRRYAPRLRTEWRTRRIERHESESAYFSRVLAHCRSNDAQGAYSALGQWVRRCGMRSIREWMTIVDVPAAREPVAALERELHREKAPATSWDGRPLARALTDARASLGGEHRGDRSRLALPALNP